MPSPFRRDQLSPEMQARYGMGRRPLAAPIVGGLVALAFLGVLVWITIGMGSQGVQYRLLAWETKAPDRVDVTFEVRNTTADDVICVIRAQDQRRVDLGYVELTIPGGQEYVSMTYRLRTLAPAYTAELLGCSIGERPRVPGPQFPPGVAPPPQPHSSTD